MAWMEQRRLEYLDAMGIQVWKSRLTPADKEVPCEFEGHDSWELIQEQVQACKACARHQSRAQAISGQGSPHADWLVLGFAPDDAEDLLGQPFAGQSKALLDEMLRAIGISPAQVYFSHLLKCHSAQLAQPDEIQACMPFIQRQAALLNPKMILCLGEAAAQGLLNGTDSLEDMRGRTFFFENNPMRVTYHPSDLLRFPLDKRKAWDDLRSAVDIYRQD